MNIKTVLKVISKVAAHISEKAEERRNAPRKPKMGDIIFCQRLNSLYKHFGVYIGNGYAIEAMGTRYGVVKTRVAARSWTHWLKIPYINYIEETEESP